MMVQWINISKSFGEKQVLSNVNLQVDAGRPVCLMGPSGYGKTTLLNILLGLLEPDTGRVDIPPGTRFAPVFQEDRLCEGLSAGANIRMTARSKLDEQTVTAMLERLGLPGTAHTPARELSGGMRRRICIARALLSGGNVFVFDEPFKGLDEETKTQAIDCIKEYCAGKVFIYVSHDEREAAALGARVVHFPL